MSELQESRLLWFRSMGHCRLFRDQPTSNYRFTPCRLDVKHTSGSKNGDRHEIEVCLSFIPFSGPVYSPLLQCAKDQDIGFTNRSGVRPQERSLGRRRAIAQFGSKSGIDSAIAARVRSMGYL